MHGSRARDLYEGHQGVFTLDRIAPPETEAYRGPEFLTVFGATVDRLSTWIKESV